MNVDNNYLKIKENLINNWPYPLDNMIEFDMLPIVGKPSERGENNISYVSIDTLMTFILHSNAANILGGKKDDRIS